MSEKEFKGFLLFLSGAIIAIVVMFPFTACAKGSGLDFTRDDSWSFYDFKMRISDEVEEWVDKETGVHYLVLFDDSTVRCMSPRYDEKGKIMVD